MDIAKAFEVAFNRKIEKNWEKIYVVVDIHDTILRASYENEESYDYYPYSREALQLMTNREDICLILWSGCYDEKMSEYRAHFAEEGLSRLFGRYRGDDIPAMPQTFLYP